MSDSRAAVEKLEMRRLLSAVPLDNPSIVNTTSGDHWPESVALAADGRYVVSYGDGDGNSHVSMFRTFDAAGNPLTGQIIVHHGEELEGLSKVVIAPDGNIVMVWGVLTQSGGRYWVDFWGGRFDWSGNALGSQFRVTESSLDAGEQLDTDAIPNLAMTASPSGFIVAWEGGDGGSVYVRRFATDSTPLSGAVASSGAVNIKWNVDGEGEVENHMVAVGADSNGNYTIAWQGQGAADSMGIYMRRFDSTGGAQGPAALVNTTTAGTQEQPTLAVSPTGGIAVAWRDRSTGSSQVRLQRLNAGGEKVEDEVIVDADAWSSAYATVALNSAGTLAVGYRAFYNDGNSDETVIRVYAPDGGPLGPAMRAHAPTTASDEPAGIGLSDSGRVVLAWGSESGSGDDESDTFVRRFQTIGEDNVLTLDGTLGDDIITAVLNGGNLDVSRNGHSASFDVTKILGIGLNGFMGNDTLSLSSNVAISATLAGGLGNDTLVGGASADKIRGGGGADSLRGGAGDDTIRGAIDNDTIVGGAGDDSLAGGAGNDIIKGVAGNDTLLGSGHSDTLIGGAGDDWLFAREGFADSLRGGAGYDRADIDDGDTLLDEIEEIVTLI